MPTPYGEIARLIHESFNARDWDGMAEMVSHRCVLTDARRVVHRGRPGFLEYHRAWAEGFPTSTIADARYYEHDTTVVAQFVREGTHDGPLGPLAATNRRVELPTCEIFQFAGGQVLAMEAYFDVLGLLVQLDQIDVPPTYILEPGSRVPRRAVRAAKRAVNGQATRARRRKLREALPVGDTAPCIDLDGEDEQPPPDVGPSNRGRVPTKVRFRGAVRAEERTDPKRRDQKRDQKIV